MHIDSDRIFQGESTFPGHEEWFYRAREGIAGPYLNRDDAALALCLFVKYCKDNRLAGGRPTPARGGRARLARRLARLVREAFSGRVAAQDFKKAF